METSAGMLVALIELQPTVKAGAALVARLTSAGLLPGVHPD